jgi:ubiquinone/menaquinone biosynthesis C-methylase UbiE
VRADRLNREADRVIRVYSGRTAETRIQYRAERPENLLALHNLERVLLTELAARLHIRLRNAQVLDVGCGGGGWLTRLASHGLPPASAHGVDLRPDAIERAKSYLPSADVRVGNAAALPFPDESMDLVAQFTMLSSVEDPDVRAAIAREMTRVVRPDGVIVSYDFWIHPRNPNTRGITKRELVALFDGHHIDARSVTLAPPIARRVAPRSYHLALALQAVPPLRTHRLAFISPRPSARVAGNA